MEWNGVGWSGVEWGGVEWGGAVSSPNYPDHKLGLPAVRTYKTDSTSIFCSQLINFFKSRPDYIYIYYIIYNLLYTTSSRGRRTKSNQLWLNAPNVMEILEN